MKRFCYARVSSKDQNLDRQIDRLTEKDADGKYKYLSDIRDLYEDQASGKDFNRPGWAAIMHALRDGDELTVTSLDRLGRSYQQIKDVWSDLTDKGVKIRVLDMPELSTDTLTGRVISDIVISLLSYVAETEREAIKKRQREGLEAAKKRGKKVGRPPIKRPDNWDEVIAEYRAGKIKAVEARRRLGNMPKSTFYRELKL